MLCPRCAPAATPAVPHAVPMLCPRSGERVPGQHGQRGAGAGRLPPGGHQQQRVAGGPERKERKASTLGVGLREPAGVLGVPALGLAGGGRKTLAAKWEWRGAAGACVLRRLPAHLGQGAPVPHQQVASVPSPFWALKRTTVCLPRRRLAPQQAAGHRGGGLQPRPLAGGPPGAAAAAANAAAVAQWAWKLGRETQPGAHPIQSTSRTATQTICPAPAAQVIPAPWLRLFSPKEVNQLLGGGEAAALDVDDMQAHTVYRWCFIFPPCKESLQKGLLFVVVLSGRPCLRRQRLAPHTCAGCMHSLSGAFRLPNRPSPRSNGYSAGSSTIKHFWAVVREMSQVGAGRALQTLANPMEASSAALETHGGGACMAVCGGATARRAVRPLPDARRAAAVSCNLHAAPPAICHPPRRRSSAGC